MNMIKNQTKGTIISLTCKKYNTVFQKARGLMFSYPKTLLFDFKKVRPVTLHMFFVFFPIDVLFLDEDYKVMSIKENFRPFSPFLRAKAKYVIEAPAGSIRKSKTGVGDKIRISP